MQHHQIYNNKYINDFNLFNNDKTVNKRFWKNSTCFEKDLYYFWWETSKVYEEAYNEKKSYDVINIDGQINDLITFF